MRWDEPAWREEAAAWIYNAVAAVGAEMTGPLDDVRLAPWAAVMRVPTTLGPLYFKEPVPGLAQEARVFEILARRQPELVTEVLVADGAGRMLMRDGGTPLSAILEQQPDIVYWERALPVYAELQIDSAPEAGRLLDVGAFDRRAAVLPALYEELLADLDLLRVGLSDGLTVGEYERLRHLRPDVAHACEELAAHGVPETIQNDDLTHGSIFLTDGSFRFLDWGDACVSHPFFSLTVTLRVIELVHELPRGSRTIERVLAAYLEPFTRFEPRSTLTPLAVTARRWGQICRAALWAEVQRARRYADEPDQLAWSLRMLLDPEIWRTFSE